MADRTKIETGDQQRTIMDNETKGGGKSPDFSYHKGEISEAEENAMIDAENKSIRENRRDKIQYEKLPDDPLDPASGKTPGQKNPHSAR